MHLFFQSKPRAMLQADESYQVVVTTLNLRAEPSAEAEVVRVLTAGYAVTMRELVNEKWLRVTAESADLEDVEGYLARAHLVV